MKIKGIEKALSKFNNWPATARIYLDTANGRVWCETFVNPPEGRFQRMKSSIIEVHNKETLDGKKEEFIIDSDFLKNKCSESIEEFEISRKYK